MALLNQLGYVSEFLDNPLAAVLPLPRYLRHLALPRSARWKGLRQCFASSRNLNMAHGVRVMWLVWSMYCLLYHAEKVDHLQGNMHRRLSETNYIIMFIKQNMAPPPSIGLGHGTDDSGRRAMSVLRGPSMPIPSADDGE